MASPPFGRLVRRYRHKLGLSQEKVAERAGISARHLSFLENGKAQPSREAALEIAHALEVPAHELGTILEAAGYLAPYTPESASPRAAASRAQLDALLRVVSDPALLHDRYGTVTAMNARARALIALFVSPKLLETIYHVKDGRERGRGEHAGGRRRRRGAPRAHLGRQRGGVSSAHCDLGRPE